MMKNKPVKTVAIVQGSIVVVYYNFNCVGGRESNTSTIFV